ncbi:MAG: hypothetical protein PVSMB7_28900 [Chloroflexota bacterium]
MARKEQPPVPLWAEAKAKKKVDVLKEVARALQETDRIRSKQAIDTMTEADLGVEQLRLQDLLRQGTLTVEQFRRLREIDFYLEGMQMRSHFGPAHEHWEPERFGDE